MYGEPCSEIPKLLTRVFHSSLANLSDNVHDLFLTNKVITPLNELFDNSWMFGVFTSTYFLPFDEMNEHFSIQLMSTQFVCWQL